MFVCNVVAIVCFFLFFIIMRMVPHHKFRLYYVAILYFFLFYIEFPFRAFWFNQLRCWWVLAAMMCLNGLRLCVVVFMQVVVVIIRSSRL